MYRLALVVIALWGCGSKDADPPATPSPSASAEPSASAKPSPANDHQLHRIDTPDRIQITGTAVPLATQPTQAWIGLPMSGDIDVLIDVHHLDDPARANGTFQVSCPRGCRLGDDRSTITPGNPRASTFADEIRVGPIDFDRAALVADIKDGKATVTTFDIASKDLIIEVDGTVELANPLSDSRVDLCVRFGPKPGLEARDPRLHALLMTTGAAIAGDGLMNIRLTGKLGAIQKRGVTCDGSTPPPLARPQLTDPPPTDPPPPAPDPAADTKTARLVEKAVTKKSDTTYDVDHASLAALLSDPTILTKSARVVPAIRNGQPQGFKIYAIRPASLYARLGWLNGDTLISVAGQPLTSVDRALEAYTKVRGAKVGQQVEVVVERRGKPLALTYTLR